MSVGLLLNHRLNFDFSNISNIVSIGYFLGTPTMHSPGHIDFIPDNSTQNEALDSYKTLSKGLQDKITLTIQVQDQPGSSVKLSNRLSQLFVSLLEEIASGSPVSIVSLQSEMTTQQGADLLNVSRPFFVKLLEEGAIPFHKVGKHRRVNSADVISYKQKFAKTSDDAITQLVESAQALDMGYKIDK